MARRGNVLLLWYANGDPVERFDSPDVRTTAPFVIWKGLRYDRVPRQQATARIVHYQTRTILLRIVT